MSGNEARARALAADFRARQHLGLAPIKDVFELVHATVGVDVMSMEADEAEHGLTMMDPDTGTVVIAVATTHHPMRQRSSVVHELGHFVAGDLDSPGIFHPGRRTPEEICADAFARHLLLPLEAVLERLGDPGPARAESDLSALVQEFELSPHMVAIQMRDAGLIDAVTCKEWSSLSAPKLATRFGWFSQYHVLARMSQVPRAPQSLMTRAVEGYRRGVLGLTELIAWYGPDAPDLLAELGPGPQDAPVDVERDDDTHDDWDDDWDSDAPLFPDGPPATS